jgi:hypothetical protein
MSKHWTRLGIFNIRKGEAGHTRWKKEEKSGKPGQFL